MAGNKSRKLGNKAEKIVKQKLISMGFKMVEKVTTPKTSTGIYLRTCSGDFRAVGEGGRSVLVEVKYRDRNLRVSDFEKHQIDSLIGHAQAGGITMIFHVCHKGILISDVYPVCDFKDLIKEAKEVFKKK